MSIDRNNKHAFKGTAKVYDRTRSTYPSPLLDQICNELELKPGMKALEIGCGTGIATRSFVKRGFIIHAIDIAEDLLECANESLRGSTCTFELTSFENYLGDGNFDFIYSATAFHWVDPRIGYDKVWDYLKDKGKFIILSSNPDFDDLTRKDLDKIYLKHAPKLTSNNGNRPSTTKSALAEQLEYFSNTTRFKDFRKSSFHWIREFTSQEYVDLLSTYSDHILLETKNELFAAVKDYIDKAPTPFKIHYETVALTARKSF